MQVFPYRLHLVLNSSAAVVLTHCCTCADNHTMFATPPACRYVDVYNTHRGSVYERAGERPWTQLTTRDKIRIKTELNEFKKNEMVVHPDSAKFTRFHK
jgi:hypothetical protein